LQLSFNPHSWEVMGNIARTPRDTNPKTEYGLAKPGLGYVPPVALFEVGRVMEVGAAKYGPMNWRKDPVSYSTYYNAALRHMMAAWDGQFADPDTGINHLAHAAANLLILIDANEQGTLLEDRPAAGKLCYYLAANTQPIEKDD
jgi:hypothetical protein